MSAGEMIHLPPDRSEKFRCGWCGGVCYYPQPTRGDRTLKMPYRYCPHCGCGIRKVLEAGEPEDRYWADLADNYAEWERMKGETDH